MNKKSALRLVIVGLLIVGLVLVGRYTPASEYFSLEVIRATMEQLGWLGIVFFLIAFALGELISVPGLVFVGVAAAVYGPVVGGLVAYGGAVFSVMVSFIIVRTVGGKPLGEIKWSFFKKMMAKLEQRPILVVAILRVVLAISPPLNYALALSPIKLRSYLIGSAIGLFFPVVGVAMGTHYGLSLGFW